MVVAPVPPTPGQKTRSVGEPLARDQCFGCGEKPVRSRPESPAESWWKERGAGARAKPGDAVCGIPSWRGSPGRGEAAGVPGLPSAPGLPPVWAALGLKGVVEWEGEGTEQDLGERGRAGMDPQVPEPQV